MEHHEHETTDDTSDELRGTRVRVACDRCGIQQLPARALTLRVCEDDGTTTVRYDCSRCGLRHVTAATADQATALAACDEVRFEAWRLPVKEEATGADQPLSEMEVDAWARLLADDTVLGRALEALAELPDGESA